MGARGGAIVRGGVSVRVGRVGGGKGGRRKSVWWTMREGLEMVNGSKGGSDSKAGE